MNKHSETGSEALKRIRTERGVSMAKLTTHLGVTEGAGWLWERGETSPRRNRVVEIDEFLNAGGALTAAYGYVSSGDRGDADRVDALAEQVDLLAQQVGHLADVLGVTLDEITAEPEPGE